MTKIKYFFTIMSVFFYAQLSSADRSCVIFANKEIICLTKNDRSFTPSERCRIIEERLKHAHNNDKFNPQHIFILKEKNSTNIIAEDHVIIAISDDDALDFGISRDELAAHVLAKIHDGFNEQRKRARPRVLLLAILCSLLASMAYGFLLFVISFFYRKIHTKFCERKNAFIRPISFWNYEIINKKSLINLIFLLIKTLKIICYFSLSYGYISVVFSFFPQTAAFTTKLIDYAWSPLQEIWSIILSFIPNIFFIIAIIIITKYILKLVEFVFKEIDRGKLIVDGFYPEWAQPTYKLVRFIICAFAFVMAFPYIPGSSSPAFKGVSVFLGLLLSVGSSSAISNIVAGIVITYMRPFRVGDSVKIADTIGDVVERNLFVTRIRTMKEFEITIPNSMALASHIVNFSVNANTGVILNTSLSIAYEVPWRKVHELLKKAALSTADVESDPSPFILQLELKDSFVSYELNAYTRKPCRMPFIYSELHEHIQDYFLAAGISIKLPLYLQMDRDARLSLGHKAERTKSIDVLN